jgi:hypothetical protein
MPIRKMVDVGRNLTRWLIPLSAIILMTSACEITRTNTVAKIRVKNMTLDSCYVADRCDVTP